MAAPEVTGVVDAESGQHDWDGAVEECEITVYH